MEERVYDKDPYCRSCEGTVLWCRPAQKQGKTVYEAAFDRVLFYPEGGGQPSDTGTAGEARVLEAHQREGQVVCTLDRPLEPGSQAVQVLDWDRRFPICSTTRESTCFPDWCTGTSVMTT